MPYVIDQVGSRFVVRKRGGTKALGTHRSKAQAQAQVDALYAQEGAAAKSLMSDAADRAAQGTYALGSLYNLAACSAADPELLAPLDAAIEAVTDWLGLMRVRIGTDDDMAMTASRNAEMYPGKAWADPVKAEDMTTTQLDSWLAGKRPRRVLVVPLGGPLPGGKAGLDLDGEYFDTDTDLYGPYPQLRATRERLVDWHHDQDPTGVMKGAILGRIDLDDDWSADGMWADFWANAGERRRTLVAALERQDIPLYGSSQAVPGAVRKADDGHILTWPLIRHTITTSPQNPLAVVPPLKALLLARYPSDATSKAALEAALLGGATPQDLLGTAGTDGHRDPTATAGAASTVAQAVMAEADTLLGRLARLARRT